ncbi:hypothetical protein SLEP1_g57235 [Rubroshorea leprosula]|uniref:Aminotransferase-like plant mobile domain-containing protein n=1 Tax=Rubroshorea leprosula TaxID=152421 RepID=A0AAV5MN13_9ROSI|nr:hypothetical protein SLEP1_g57235 [Rubroshorea leprosula]
MGHLHRLSPSISLYFTAGCTLPLLVCPDLLGGPPGDSSCFTGLSGLCPVAPTAEQPSLAKIISMAHNREEQSMPTGSAPMAGPKAIHCLRPPPPELIKLFQDQNLQDDMNRILQKQKPCHSNQTFVPHKKSKILGPYFVSHPPAPLASIYPQPKEHLLPFQVKPDWNKWIGSFGAWPVWRKSEWTDWINRLEPAFGQIWRDAGLFEFIQLTKCRFTMDKPVLGAALLFWSGSFNCFHFPCGAMSVSLFDVSSLTGLPCTGEEISALLTLPPGVEYNAELKPSYPAFMSSAYDKSKPVSADEHISFLLTLIGKYIVCSAGKGPTKEFIPWRSCQDITAHPVISGGPLWVLQLWLYSYFPALAPVSSAVPARDLLTYGFMFKNAVENEKNFEECLKADVSSPDFRAFWSVCVTYRDLFVGCSLNTLNSRCGMELYAPNQFCRQLGYCQDIPFPPLFTFNYSYPLRFIIGDSKILVTKLADISKTLQTLILPDPPFRPSCTSSYKSWWRDYFHPRFLDVMENIFVLAPPQLTKKSEGKKVVKENEDLESVMAAQISQPDLPRRVHKLQVKRKFATPADSMEEDTPSKQRRTGGIKRSAIKPSAAKKLIKSASPSGSSSATETETQLDKTKDVPLGPAAMKAPVEDIPTEGDGSNSGSSHTKSGDGSSPATKVRGSRFSSRIASKSFRTVRPNEFIDLSPDKENTPTPVASPAKHVHVDDIEVRFKYHFGPSTSHFGTKIVLKL